MASFNLCKRQLTTRWVDEICRKYAVIKSEIQGVFVEMEKILSPQQMVDIKATLTDRYKEVATRAMSKSIRKGSSSKKPTPAPAPRPVKDQASKGKRNKQVQNLLLA